MRADRYSPISSDSEDKRHIEKSQYSDFLSGLLLPTSGFVQSTGGYLNRALNHPMLLCQCPRHSQARSGLAGRPGYRITAVQEPSSR